MNKQKGKQAQPSKLFSKISNLTKPPTEIFQSGFGERAWLKARGKIDYITFTDEALLQLRKYFESLDELGTGSIGVEQLQDPFIAFGLSENRKDVEELIQSVDLDGSGTIEFNEFLEIMSNIKRNKGAETNKNSAILDFFKKLSSGDLGDEFDSSMNFKLNVYQYRRKRILQSMMSNNKQVKEKGLKITENFKKQINNNPLLREALMQSKKSPIFIHGFETKNSKKNKI